MFRPAAVLAAASVAAWAAPADREVAEWTLLHGGRVALVGAPSTARALADVSALPAGDGFELALVDWVGVSALPQDLARLAGLSRLRELRLPGPIWNRNADGGKDLSAEMRHLAKLGTLERITFSDHFLDNIRFRDAGLLAISGLDNLRELSLRQAEIKGPGLKPFRLLQSLDITLCPVRDEGFAEVAAMKGLRRLRAANTQITSTALAGLSGLTALEELDLSATEIDDAGVAHLASLKNLRRLQLASTGITDASLDVLAALPALEELNLYRTKVTNAGLARLKKLPALRDVDARYTRATAAGVAELSVGGRVRVAFSAPVSGAAPLPPLGNDAAAWIRKVGGTISADASTVSLRGIPVSAAVLARLLGAIASSVRSLDLSATGIGDESMAALARLPLLAELDLAATTVTDRGLAALAPATGLRKLVLDNTYVEGHGLARTESLEELDALGAPITDAGLAVIARSAPHLRRLHLAETDVTAAGLAALAPLKQLAHLDLAATDIADSGLPHVGKLTALRFLRLRETRLTDAGLAHLAPLAASLEFLDLGRTRISSAGMPSLARLTSLRRLVLEYAEVDDTGLAPLAALTHLTELNLDSTHVTDRSVAQLSAYAALGQLNLYHTLVTAQGIERLKQARPACRIVWDPESSLNNRRRA